MLPLCPVRSSSQPNIPVPVAVAGGLVLALLLLFAGVAATMGSAPEQAEMRITLPVE